MASENIQFNAIITDDLAKRVKTEAVNQGVTLGEFSTQAFLKFLALPITQRRAALAEHKKILGRKIGIAGGKP